MAQTFSVLHAFNLASEGFEIVSIASSDDDAMAAYKSAMESGDYLEADVYTIEHLSMSAIKEVLFRDRLGQIASTLEKVFSLRDALVWLVGESDPEKLKQLRTVVSRLPTGDDGPALLRAIDVLLETA
mgnify:FL=1